MRVYAESGEALLPRAGRTKRKRIFDKIGWLADNVRTRITENRSSSAARTPQQPQGISRVRDSSTVPLLLHCATRSGNAVTLSAVILSCIGDVCAAGTSSWKQVAVVELSRTTLQSLRAGRHDCDPRFFRDGRKVCLSVSD